MQTSIDQFTMPNKTNFRSILALIIIVCSFAFLFLLLYRPVPEQNRDIVNIAAGYLLALATGVTAWYFGSSKSKEDGDKVEQLYRINEQEILSRSVDEAPRRQDQTTL